MIGSRDRLRFAVETGFHFGVIREMRRKNFDRNRAVQACIAGFVHFAHTTCADGGEDFVGAESLACGVACLSSSR